jgi:predicted nucleic acid-binding protein
MSQVLLDTNVLLDVFLGRSPWLAAAAVLQANHDGRITGHVSAVTLPTIFYVVRRNSGLPEAHRVVQECLNSFEIVAVDRPAVELACTMPGPDFEDNLQAACATLARLTAIVTRDPRGYAQSAVPACTPADLLASLPAGPSSGP